ncbi:FAD-binding domain-containing protein [Mycena rebaudengoi]|nr:FAD-binding domain-containing protein [Mycena rebaudengoi]
MKSLSTSLVLLIHLLSYSSSAIQATPGSEERHACRNVPGSAGFPTAAAWKTLNSTVSGRLVDVVPTAKYCANLPGGCTDEQWTSAIFRITIPGAMDQSNFEQAYDALPPSLCFRNGTTCGQGNVPLYSVEAKTTEDIQAAVKFASRYNLRLAVKASGHDTLGRSTAPNSLLVRTSNFKNITHTAAFFVGKENMGPAITVGSGVTSKELYKSGLDNGRAVAAGASASVCPSGGFVQGAGHSPLGPILGVAADNALEFDIVNANGDLLKVNMISHPDLFFALRGGGSGSWGVVVSVTFRTYPTFNAATRGVFLSSPHDVATSALAGIHAEHIFDWDAIRGSHSFIVFKDKVSGGSTIFLSALLPNTTKEQAGPLMAPWLKASLTVPGTSVLFDQQADGDVNGLLILADDNAAINAAIGSRLLPIEMYRRKSPSPSALVAQVYTDLLKTGAGVIIENVVAGGRVSENAVISNAVHPAWRKAKTHLTILNDWTESASLPEIAVLQKKFQKQQRAIIERLTGPNAGSYSSEADPLEPEFKTTFYGPNYAKLSAIKHKYDPKDLFIVRAGVGSERWDEWGMCRV